MRGQIAPNPLFGSGTSKTILCLPLIFPSHASSAGSGDAVGVSAARADGTELLSPIAAAPAAMRLRKPRRAVFVSIRFDMGEPSGLLAMNGCHRRKYLSSTAAEGLRHT